MKELTLTSAARHSMLAAGVTTLFLTTLLQVVRLAADPMSLPGRDGYYYLIQARSLMEYGWFHYPTRAPLGLLAIVVPLGLGNGSALAFAITASTLVAAVVALLHLTLRGFEVPNGLAIALSVGAALSSLRHYFVLEFLANLVGLVAVLGLFAAVSLQMGRWAIAVLATICILSHPSAALAALVFLAAFATLPKGSTSGMVAWGVIASVLGALVLVRLMASPYEFPASTVAAPELAALAMLAPAWTISIRAGSKHTGRFIAALWVTAAAFCLNPLLPLARDAATFGVRLSLWSWVFLPLLAGGTVHGLWRVGYRTSAVLTLVALSVLVAIPRVTASQEQGFLDKQSRLRTAIVQGLALQVPPTAAVVAEHGLQFLVTAHSGLTAVSDRNDLRRSSSDVFWLIDTMPVAVASALDHWVLVPEKELPMWWGGLLPAERARILAQNRQHLAPAPK